MYYVRRGLVKYVPPGQSNLYKIASALIDFFYVKWLLHCTVYLTFHFFVTEEILYSIIAVSDQGSQAKPLCYRCSYLLGTCYHLTRVNRWSDCICYRIEILCLIGTLSTILQHWTHPMKTQGPTSARQRHFALWYVSHRQSCHLSTPSRPWVPPVWPYCSQAQCGYWFTV